MENHHEDKYLVLRTIVQPYPGAGTITIVEDQYGSVDKMALYNQGNSTILQSIPKGSVVLVKEPYYRFSGDNDFMLCIDHPSDIVLLRQGPDDALIPDIFRAVPEFDTAAGWKAAGDRAFISKKLPLAVAK